MGEAKRKGKTSKTIFVIRDPQASAMYDELCIRKNITSDKSKHFLYLDSEGLVGYRNFPNEGMVAHKVPSLEGLQILSDDFDDITDEEKATVEKTMKAAKLIGINLSFNDGLVTLREIRKSNDGALNVLGYKRHETVDGVAEFRRF